jgi:ActR/RegA family two-component response regulator
MKKILLIDDSDTYTWCLRKYLQHRGYPVKTASTLKNAGRHPRGNAAGGLL